MRVVVLWANSAVCESLISLTVRSGGHSSANGAVSQHHLQQTGFFLLPPCSESFQIDKGDMVSSLYSEPVVTMCVRIRACALSLCKHLLKAT